MFKTQVEPQAVRQVVSLPSDVKNNTVHTASVNLSLIIFCLPILFSFLFLCVFHHVLQCIYIYI